MRYIHHCWTRRRLLENFPTECKENSAGGDCAGGLATENLLAIEYYHRAEYKKMATLPTCKDQGRGVVPECFIHYLALLRSSPIKILMSVYHQRLVPQRRPVSQALDDHVFWNLLLAMYENRLGMHDKAVASAASVFSVCPFIFEAWSELGWALSHLATAEGGRAGGTVDRLFALLRENGHSEIASLLAMHLRGQWRIDCVPPQADHPGAGRDEPLYGFYLHQRALCLSTRREYEEARRTFEALLRRRPEHTDGMDAYSDILYLMGDSVQLAILDGRFARLVGNETASAAIAYHIRGNHLCLKGDYAGAAMMFHRAARADTYHYVAWILAAQQYLELRSPEAAIDCFLRATGRERARCRPETKTTLVWYRG